MRQQPPRDPGSLVGGQVIADQVHVVAGGDGLVDRGQELTELGGTVLGVDLGDHPPRGGSADLQRGEQVQGAGPDVVMRHALGGAGH
jgi:hypothetical protein